VFSIVCKEEFEQEERNVGVSEERLEVFRGLLESDVVVVVFDVGVYWLCGVYAEGFLTSSIVSLL
jgi:hypothetical protein